LSPDTGRQTRTPASITAMISADRMGVFGESGKWPASTTSGLRILAARNQRAGAHGLGDLAFLVQGDVFQPDDPYVRPGTRRSRLQYFSLHSEHVSGPHSMGPPQFVHPETDSALGKVQRFDKQTHRDRRRVPSTGDQPFKNR